MQRHESRRVALILAAEITMIAAGALALGWFGVDIVVKALRLTLIGTGV